MQGQVIDVSTSFFPLCWSLCGLKLLLCENKKKQKKHFLRLLPSVYLIMDSQITFLWLVLITLAAFISFFTVILYIVLLQMVSKNISKFAFLRTFKAFPQSGTFCGRSDEFPWMLFNHTERNSFVILFFVLL